MTLKLRWKGWSQLPLWARWLLIVEIGVGLAMIPLFILVFR